MKKNLTVLVLLVAWSLLSAASLTSASFADEFAFQDPPDGSDAGEVIIEGNGANDDGTGGDPGDAGDGYGISGQPITVGGNGMGGNDGVEDTILDELWLILTSLIQLAL